MRFAGIDLAWKVDCPRQGSTAICVLSDSGRIEALELVTTDEEIIGRLPEDDGIWVGIDAPLLVPNLDGMRGCERLVRAMGIRILPSNRSFMERRYGGRRGEALTTTLYRRGFAPATPASRSGRRVFEVYPYGTLHVLAGGEVPAYKRGRFEAKRGAMLKAVAALEGWDAPPGLADRLRDEVEGASASSARAAADLIDAALCVTCLYRHWLSRGRETRLIGDEEHGYILLPALRSNR